MYFKVVCTSASTLDAQYSVHTLAGSYPQPIPLVKSDGSSAFRVSILPHGQKKQDLYITYSTKDPTNKRDLPEYKMVVT